MRSQGQGSHYSNRNQKEGVVFSEFNQITRNIKKNNSAKLEEKQGMKKNKGLCECGCYIKKDGLIDHLKTKKHNKLMEVKNEYLTF